MVVVVVVVEVVAVVVGLYSNQIILAKYFSRTFLLTALNGLAQKF